jgi:hypothetical protein
MVHGRQLQEEKDHESYESHELRRRDGEEVKAVEIILKDEAYAIVGACFEVYNEKGCGFLEAVYQECLEIELQLRGIPFLAKEELRLEYKGRTLKKTYSDS